MAIRTKSLSDASDKWSRRASVAQIDFTKGVTGAGAAWEAGAKAGSDNYKQGVTAAIARDAFSKGISATGANGWEAKTILKGPGRFAEGVSVSKGDYEKGMGPVLQTLQGLTLPPRAPSGDPRNIQRVSVPNAALAALKRR
jgi:hypothetical protein